MCVRFFRLIAIALAFWLASFTRVESVLAHGSGSSEYLSSVTAVGMPGVTAYILFQDDYLFVQVTNATEVTVEGYQGEPYARIGPAGVFLNRRSPAYFLNQDRFVSGSIPDSADPYAEPEWEQVSSSPYYSWHDHRIHWMSDARPPSVEDDPSERQVIFEWSVPIVGAQPSAIEGKLEWVPTADKEVWRVAAVALAVLFVAGVGVAAKSGPAVALSLGALALAAGGTIQSGLHANTNFHDRSITLLIATAVVSLLLAATARRYLIDRSRGRALDLAGAGVFFFLVAGVLHFFDARRVIIESRYDLLLPALAALNIVAGGSLFVALVLLARRSRWADGELRLEVEEESPAE